jgi:hypothetical protein
MGEGIFTQQEESMGYRSQVMLAIEKDLVPHFMAATSVNPKVQALCFQDHDVFQEDYRDEGAMLFYWSSIKWYDSPGGDVITIIEKFIDDCDGDRLSVEGERPSDLFRFIRLGEDGNDVEDKGGGFWHIDIQREISF